MKIQSYESMRPRLKSGDLMLFDGKGKMSRTVKWFSGPYSHIGIILRSQELNLVGLLESTTLSTIPDLVTGKVKAGVQFVELSRRVETYKGRVFVRKLSKDLDAERLLALSMFRREIAGRGYEKSKWEMLMSVFSDYGGREDLSSLFCSEMVAEALQRIRLILGDQEGGRPSNRWTPTEFSSEEWGEDLLDNYWYWPEIEVAR